MEFVGNKNLIELNDEEMSMLLETISKGNALARMILRANILLASDRNVKKPTTVQNVRTSCTEKGLEATQHRKKSETPPVSVKVTGDIEARIIALSCSVPPNGYESWTLRLLAARIVELNILESVSHTTADRVLKNELSLHLKKCWTISEVLDATFVENMEDVLSVYAHPYDLHLLVI